jgi:hypothetical protein
MVKMKVLMGTPINILENRITLMSKLGEMGHPMARQYYEQNT